MNRRLAWMLSACLALPLMVGCDAAAWGRKGQAQVTGYEALKNGMGEKEVVRLMGEPTRRSRINLEGTGTQATVMTYVGAGKLVNITLVDGAVRAKERF